MSRTVDKIVTDKPFNGADEVVPMSIAWTIICICIIMSIGGLIGLIGYGGYRLWKIFF
jgi:phosphatidylglycerophosphatase A